MIRAILVTMLLNWLFIAHSQVTKVKYKIKYNVANSNDTISKFDCYIFITQGSATSAIDRIQGGSQYTVIVPTGSEVTLPNANLSMPLQNNQTYTGTTPTQWSLSNQVFHPAAQPQSDFYGITNSPSPSSFYNNLVTGDSVRLFTLNVKIPTGGCKTGVRLYQNGVDPPSSAAGMAGGDFSNGFVLGFVSGGGNNQDYDGNLTSFYPNEVVKNSNDIGIGSLRKAVECAANNSTIIFDDAMINDTIKLNSKININKNLYLIQSANKVVKIKSAYDAPSLEVNAGKLLDLTNVKIIAQNNPAFDGRGIYNNGTLMLNNVKIIDPIIGTVNSGSSIRNKGTLIITGNTQLSKL